MITTLLNADYEQYYSDMEEVAAGIEFAFAHPYIARIWSFFRYEISGYVSSLYCKYAGHDIEDAGSYATPESGADHLRCKRCGESWYHQYY